MKQYIIIFFLFTAVLLPSLSQPLVWSADKIYSSHNMSHERVVILLRNADKELNKIITTVVDKGMTPASGSKHDYMSMGRYWWPNTNTKNGLPYVRKDGVSNPEIEKLDRNPLESLGRGIRQLTLSYAITNDNKYADKAHLLNGNTEYQVKIIVHNGLIRYFLNDKLFWELNDESPYTEGFFGFRTTMSHQQFNNFRVFKLE